jgi:hypothetical protein
MEPRKELILNIFMFAVSVWKVQYIEEIMLNITLFSVSF